MKPTYLVVLFFVVAFAFFNVADAKTIRRIRDQQAEKPLQPADATGGPYFDKAGWLIFDVDIVRH